MGEFPEVRIVKAITGPAPHEGFLRDVAVAIAALERALSESEARVRELETDLEAANDMAKSKVAALRAEVERLKQLKSGPLETWVFNYINDRDPDAVSEAIAAYDYALSECIAAADAAHQEQK